MKSQKKSSGNKKHGRNKIKGADYRKRGKRERSHIERIEKHIKKYGDTSPALQETLEKYKKALRLHG